MIEFKQVSLSFGQRAVLREIDLRIAFHERVAVVGGSGSGKTSLIKLMLGLNRPDSGEILIEGTEITSLTENDLRPIRLNFNIVFQEGALFDSLSVRENAAFCLRERFKLSEAEIDSKVRGVLRRLGIEEAIDMMPEELSGGMLRRVAIARSLAECEPRMFLYDEPTTGLDPITAEQIGDLIADLSSGAAPQNKGFIIVSHRVSDVARLTQRLIFLHDGSIRFDGPFSELRHTRDALLRTFFKEVLSVHPPLEKNENV
jgi:phospholipid/cholesterol/gamma-HCH transport system ATP-binding protein